MHHLLESTPFTAMVHEGWTRTSSKPRLVQAPSAQSVCYGGPQFVFLAISAFFIIQDLPVDCVYGMFPRYRSFSHEPENLEEARRAESEEMGRYLQELRSRAAAADSMVRKCLLFSKQEYLGMFWSKQLQ
jgi:hypothetical protein